RDAGGIPEGEVDASLVYAELPFTSKLVKPIHRASRSNGGLVMKTPYHGTMMVCASEAATVASVDHKACLLRYKSSAQAFGEAPSPHCQAPGARRKEARCQRVAEEFQHW